MNKRSHPTQKPAAVVALALTLFPQLPATAGMPNRDWSNIDLDFTARKTNYRVISNSVLIQNKVMPGINHLPNATASGQVFSTPRGNSFFTGEARVKRNSEIRESAQARLWALACPALITVANGHKHDVLWCLPATAKNVAAEKKELADGWGINSRRDLLAQLNWISLGGHRAEFEQMYKLSQSDSAIEAIKAKLNPKSRNEFEERIGITREYAPKFGMKSLIGWDYCRYIALCRWGTLCGYLSPEEAWDKIMPAAQLLQNTFSSWKDLGKNFVIGRRYWQPNSEQQASIDLGYKSLLSDPRSPWCSIPWRTNLSAKQ